MITFEKKYLLSILDTLLILNYKQVCYELKYTAKKDASIVIK